MIMEDVGDMNDFFCEEIGKTVNYSIASINASTLTDGDARIPGIISCSNILCSKENCPLEEIYSKWLKSRQ